MSSFGISGLDSSTLLGYYQAKLSASPSALAASNRIAAQNTTAHSATMNDNPPWNTPTPTNAKTDAKILSTTNWLDTTNVPLSAGATSDTKMEQDNQKLFSLYNAVNSLAYLAKMSQAATSDGQRAGQATRFPAGLAQVLKYLGTASFNSF